MLPKRSKVQVNLAPKSSDFRAGTIAKTEDLFDQKHQQEMEYVPVLGVIQERPPNQVATVVHMYCIYIPEKGGTKASLQTNAQAAFFSLPETLLHTDAFTYKHLHTETFLHTDPFKHRSFFTQTLLHTNILTQKHFCHNAFTHKQLHTATLLHTEPFTHRPFYTQTP